MDSAGDFPLFVLDFDAFFTLGKQPCCAIGKESNFAVRRFHVARASCEVDETTVLGVVARILVVS